jgi:hypothetical protein
MAQMHAGLQRPSEPLPDLLHEWNRATTGSTLDAVRHIVTVIESANPISADTIHANSGFIIIVVIVVIVVIVIVIVIGSLDRGQHFLHWRKFVRGFGV